MGLYEQVKYDEDYEIIEKGVVITIAHFKDRIEELEKGETIYYLDSGIGGLKNEDI